MRHTKVACHTSWIVVAPALTDLGLDDLVFYYFTEAKDPPTECDKEQVEDPGIDLCAEGLEKEPGADLETEESGPGDGKERPVHGVCQGATGRPWRCLGETSERTFHSGRHQAVDNLEWIARAKTALMIWGGQLSRDGAEAEDTASDRSPCERGKMLEGTPSLHQTAASRLVRRRARSSPPLNSMVHRGQAQCPRADSSCVEASALNEANRESDVLVAKIFSFQAHWTDCSSECHHHHDHDDEECQGQLSLDFHGTRHLAQNWAHK